jgi:hypothetical protein
MRRIRLTKKEQKEYGGKWILLYANATKSKIFDSKQEMEQYIKKYGIK